MSTTVQSCRAENLVTLIEKKNCLILDIRDPQSYAQEHIPDAKHLDKQTFDNFVAQADKQRAVCVYCYHGISSIPLAEYLAQQGFTEVYSLAGGFEGWQQYQTNSN